MPTTALVKLGVAQEPLLIPYPENWSGEKSVENSDRSFFLSCSPRTLSMDEIELAKSYVKELPYHQTVVFMGGVLVSPDDPLFAASASELSAYERRQGLPVTERNQSGGRRLPRERVHMIRETEAKRS